MNPLHRVHDIRNFPNFRLWNLQISIDRLWRNPDHMPTYTFVTREFEQLYPFFGLTAPTLPPKPILHNLYSLLQIQPDYQQTTSAPPPPTLYPPLCFSTLSASLSAPPPQQQQQQQEQLLQPPVQATQHPPIQLSSACQPHLPICQPPQHLPILPPTKQFQDLQQNAQFHPILSEPKVQPRQPTHQPAQSLLLQPQLSHPQLLPVLAPFTKHTNNPSASLLQSVIQNSPLYTPCLLPFSSPPSLVPFSSYLFPPDPRPSHLSPSLLSVSTQHTYRTPPAIQHFGKLSLLLARSTATLPARPASPFPSIAAATPPSHVPANIKVQRAGPGGESDPALPKGNPSGRSGGQLCIPRALVLPQSCPTIPSLSMATLPLTWSSPLLPLTGVSESKLGFAPFRWDPGRHLSSPLMTWLHMLPSLHLRFILTVIAFSSSNHISFLFSLLSASTQSLHSSDPSTSFHPTVRSAFPDIL